MEEINRWILVVTGIGSFFSLLWSLYELLRARGNFIARLLLVTGFSILVSTSLTVITNLNIIYEIVSHQDLIDITRTFRLIPILSGYFFSAVVYLIFKHEKPK